MTTPETNGNGKRCAQAGCGVPSDLVLVDPDGEHEPACFSHAPWLEAERAIAREKGGARYAAKAKRYTFLDASDLGALETPADALRWSRVIAGAVATGRLSSAAASIALRAIEQWTRSHESVDLERRVAEVEQRVAEADQQRERQQRERAAERPAYMTKPKGDPT